MKRFILFVSVILLTLMAFSQTKQEKRKNNELEKELLMLKNQLFLRLYSKSLSMAKGEVTPPDGSSYIQLSELCGKYAMDSNGLRLIHRWVEKKYISFDPQQKLYLMRCLDFYNSKELKQYIDSVRRIELKNQKSTQ